MIHKVFFFIWMCWRWWWYSYLIVWLKNNKSIDFTFCKMTYYDMAYILTLQMQGAVFTLKTLLPSLCCSFRRLRWLLRDDGLWHWWEPLMRSSQKLDFFRISFLHTTVCTWLTWGTQKKLSHSNGLNKSHGSFHLSSCHRQYSEQHGCPNYMAKAREQRSGYMWEWECGTQHYTGENLRVLPNVWHREQGLHHPMWHAGEVADARVTCPSF